MSGSAANPYHNNYYPILVLNFVAIVVVSVCTGLRLYVRHSLVRKVGLDDWLLLIGVHSERTGLDYPAQKRCGGRCIAQQAGRIFPYLISEVFVRLAYAVFYLRVIPPELDLRWQRWFVQGAVAVYALYQTANAFIYIFQCGSPANLGKRGPGVTGCIAQSTMGALFDSSYYFDAALDWAMAIIPMVVVWKSTMTLRTKIMVVLILLLGCCASAIAVVAIVMSKLDGAVASNFANQHHVIVVTVLVWAEPMVAIICLSLAALRPLFRKFLDAGPKTLSSLSLSSQMSPPVQHV
ncbi:hypothetical protein K461DRAFT_300080 [Myriangium duriaei CBS 260.36]|uniref:Rhodopsin domain-containing protein n=1 Tax=Myriangium duriaei CBS 260.36 TaxID=1168546 RepID=A0A9P4JG81_9PEZI|nr:hypothetical protein K461DRAFT_300080 [Myriangium duriaei CBS 260.36]